MEPADVLILTPASPQTETVAVNNISEETAETLLGAVAGIKELSIRNHALGVKRCRQLRKQIRENSDSERAVSQFP